MSRWLCLLLLVCATAHAAPDTPAPSSSETKAQFLFSQEKMQLTLTQFEEMRANMAGRTSDLVVTAMGFLGVPYRRGGNTAATGFDCSGFVRSMYEQSLGLILPRKASDQAQASESIERHDLQPGDLVFFNTMRRSFSHVGIYIGEGKFIHSPRSGQQVRVENMDESYWRLRFNGARRVTGEALQK